MRSVARDPTQTQIKYSVASERDIRARKGRRTQAWNRGIKRGTQDISLPAVIRWQPLADVV